MGSEPGLVDVIYNRGYTTLHYAARAGHFEVVRVLLERLAPQSLDAVTSAGITALHLAARKGDLDIVQALLFKHPAAINVLTRTKSNALHLAAQKGHVKVAELLLSLRPEMIHSVAMYEWTALHFAAQEGHVEVVRLLIGQSPKVIDAADVEGWTSLHVAAREGHGKVVEVILGSMTSRVHFEKVQPQVPDRNGGMLILVTSRDGQTPLHMALEQGHEHVANILLAHDPELVLAVDALDNTVLHTALKKCSTAFVAKLWELDPSALYRTNRLRRTPFHHAVLYEREEIVAMWQPAMCFDDILTAYNTIGNKTHNARVKELLLLYLEQPLALVLSVHDVTNIVRDYVKQDSADAALLLSLSSNNNRRRGEECLH